MEEVGNSSFLPLSHQRQMQPIAIGLDEVLKKCIGHPSN